MDIMDILIRNLRLLMTQHEFSTQAKIHKATGVSQTHIGNILRRDKTPGIDIVQSLAEGMGLEAWQLLAPPELLQNGLSANLSTLLNAYLCSDNSGRQTVLQVAEAQARYKVDAQEN